MIPFLDKKKISEPYETAFKEKLKVLLDNGWYILGKEVVTFLGDGGAIVTNDSKLTQVLFSLRNCGSEKKYWNEYVGVNSRLYEFQASFLNLKLSNLNSDNIKRPNIAKRYLAEIIVKILNQY